MSSPVPSLNNQGIARTMPVCRDADLVEEFSESIVEEGEMKLWWLTQASWLVKTATVSIAIDPWWRDVHCEGHWQKLLGEYPLHPSHFPRLDYVLCTHWHDDHLCPESIPRLAEAQPWLKFVIPSRSVELVESWGVPSENIISAHGHGPIDLGPLQVWCIPAAHEELDFDETGASWYLGYVLHSSGVSLFHMGDGQPWPGWHSAIKKAVARISSSDELDIALLCINGNDNLSHQQAVDLIEKVRPKAAIPMHYGMDPGNTVEPEIFVEEIEQRAPSQSFIVAKVGEKISYSNGGIL